MIEALEHIEEMRCIQHVILSFLDDEVDTEEIFQNIISFIDEKNYNCNQYKLKALLHLIAKIIDNHHRTMDFFSKIERILLHLKDDIKKNFPNWEVFVIFRSNKRILLFLIEEKILEFDEYIVDEITIGPNSIKYIKAGYPQYFSPEIKPYIKNDWFSKYNAKKSNFNCNEFLKNFRKKLPKKFFDNRKAGENDNYICKIIRNDSLQEFIENINQNSISLKQKIEPSFFETHSFLIKKQIDNIDISLVEYAAFFGAFQIFKYLINNGAKFTSSIWLFAVHGRHTEIFLYLENNRVQSELGTFKKCYMESIKCHHNEFLDHIIFNMDQKDVEDIDNLFSKRLKYYNFLLIDNEFVNESSFVFFCKYDYYIFVNMILEGKNIDINKKI